MPNSKIVKSSILTCPHGFSTRIGGVSVGTFNSLNLGMNRGDNESDVIKNWDIFLEECGIQEKQFVCGSQVHGANVHIACIDDARPAYGKYNNPYKTDKNGNPVERDESGLIIADGYVTNVPGLPLAIFTADCTPLLMQDSENNVIAAVHCGWRSTAQDIMKEAIDKMISLGARVDTIKAAIGPAICYDCFEVGKEVVDAMRNLICNNSSCNDADKSLDGNRDETDPIETNFNSLYKTSGEKYRLDLKGVVRLRLIQLGLNPDNIEDLNECTMCHPDKYWSHRITGFNRGSQANVIMLK